MNAQNLTHVPKCIVLALMTKENMNCSCLCYFNLEQNEETTWNNHFHADLEIRSK